MGVAALFCTSALLFPCQLSQASVIGRREDLVFIYLYIYFYCDTYKEAVPFYTRVFGVNYWKKWNILLQAVQLWIQEKIDLSILRVYFNIICPFLVQIV